MTVSITVPNVAEISKAIVQQLEAYPDLENVPISRSADRNMDPNGCPWIGVYRLNAAYQQRVLGFGGGVRDQRVRFLVLIMAADPSSGDACEDALEALISSVSAALLSDTTLRGTVNALEDFEVDTSEYQRANTVYMQTAALQFVAVGNTTAQVS